MSEEAQAAASNACTEAAAPSPEGAATLDPSTLLHNNQITESSSPPSDNAKWICEVCTYENYPLSRKCTMCRSPKPVLGEDIFKLQDGASALPSPEPCGAEAVTERLKPLRISSPQAQGHSSSCSVNKWPCPTCTYENWPRSMKCAMCGAPAPSPPTPTPKPSKHSIGINDICNSVVASEAEARRSKRNTTTTTTTGHTNIDWTWLQACLGVVEGAMRPVEAYLAGGGDPARALTQPEVQLLNRASAFDAGHTLVHLAIRFRRQDILAALLARIQGGGPGLKREPSYVAPEPAAALRRHLAACVRRAPLPGAAAACLYLGEVRTFRLPRGVRALPAGVRAQLWAELTDREAQAQLEAGARVRWPPLRALWNRSCGDCLPDAACQAAYGVCDRNNTLRGAVAESLAGAARAFLPRWSAAERRAARAAHYAPTDAQLRSEWARLLAAAQRPGTPLHQLHVWVLAHVLRRPIIVYGVDVINSFRGEPLGYARFRGVYLPLLWEPSFCSKSPLCLGYTRGHFSALVPMEPYAPRDYICRERDSEPEDDATFLPLTDVDGKLLPVHFLTNEEMEEPERVLRRWLLTERLEAGGMDAGGTEADGLVARQPAQAPLLLQAQMLEEWLNHYRRLAQQTRGPFPPRLHPEYSIDPETEEE